MGWDSDARTDYFAALATVGTSWAVLWLIGARPWLKIPLGYRVLGVPPIGLLLTFMVIFSTEGGGIYRWDWAIGWAGYASIAFVIFWMMQRFGDKPIARRTQIITYSIIAMISLLDFAGSNGYVSGVFKPEYLPFWFITLVVVSVVELALLAGNVRSQDGIIDVEFVEVDEQPAIKSRKP